MSAITFGDLHPYRLAICTVDRPWSRYSFWSVSLSMRSRSGSAIMRALERETATEVVNRQHNGEHERYRSGEDRPVVPASPHSASLLFQHLILGARFGLPFAST